jgi:hypothetical protein
LSRWPRRRDGKESQSLMLCRRCGMESSTTDVCEWCKKPMLAPGTTASGKPAAAGPPAEQVKEAEAGGLPVEAGGGPVEQAQAPVPEEKAQSAAASPAGEAGDVLRPLGSAMLVSAGQSNPRAPSHGLRDEQTRTSVDVSQYVGTDQSIFRPMERPDHAATLTSGSDPLAMRRKKAAKEAEKEIPENVRLLRSVPYGFVIGLVTALVQFMVTHETKGKFYVLTLGEPGSAGTAVLFGLLSGVLLWLGLAAIMVRFKLSPFVGMLMGLAVGVGLANGWWGYLAGALSGISVGIAAGKGARRVVAV